MNFSWGSNWAQWTLGNRADVFHQLTLPHTFGGWLSFVPRVGGRLTYYGDTGQFVDEVHNGVSQSVLRTAAAVLRPDFNAGFESSFKFSRAFENVQSRMVGLDGLRHVVQPYVNFSYNYSGEDPSHILQFDRLNPSTELPPIDFPQFNSVDSIDSWTILRLGVRNRLQTRRNGNTLNWRSDIKGIPIGPLGRLTPEKWDNHYFSHAKNVLFPDGITFGGRGKVTVTKQTVRDIIAATLYIIFLGVHGFLWAGWQRRGKKAAELKALETSSTYGRPLVRKA